MKNAIRLLSSTLFVAAFFSFSPSAQAASDNWPSWIGQLDTSYASSSVTVVIPMDKEPANYAERVDQYLSIPVEYRPLHYNMLSNVEYEFFPDELIQAGAPSTFDEWPLWIDPPRWY